MLEALILIVSLTVAVLAERCWAFMGDNKADQTDLFVDFGEEQ